MVSRRTQMSAKGSLRLHKVNNIALSVRCLALVPKPRRRGGVCRGQACKSCKDSGNRACTTRPDSGAVLLFEHAHEEHEAQWCAGADGVGRLLWLSEVHGA